MVILMVPLVSCKARQKAQLQELEIKIEIEASEFEELLRELMTTLSTLWTGLDDNKNCKYGDVEIQIIDANRVVVRSRNSKGEIVKEYYGGFGKYVLESSTSLTEDVGIISSTNPYKNKNALGEYETPDFTSTVNKIEESIDSIRASLNKNLNDLSHEEEIITSCYEEYVNQIEIRLSKAELYLKKIERWDFDNLDRYIELKQSLE